MLAGPAVRKVGLRDSLAGPTFRVFSQRPKKRARAVAVQAIPVLAGPAVRQVGQRGSLAGPTFRVCSQRPKKRSQGGCRRACKQARSRQTNKRTNKQTNKQANQPSVWSTESACERVFLLFGKRGYSADRVHVSGCLPFGRHVCNA